MEPGKGLFQKPAAQRGGKVERPHKLVSGQSFHCQTAEILAMSRYASDQRCKEHSSSPASYGRASPSPDPRLITKLLSRIQSCPCSACDSHYLTTIRQRCPPGTVEMPWDLGA